MLVGTSDHIFFLVYALAAAIPTCLGVTLWVWSVLIFKKSRIRETKHLSTDADSSTVAIGGWTRNTPKPDFFEKRKKLSKTQKLKNVQKYAKISNRLFDQRSLIHREAWFPDGPRIPKNPIFLKSRKNHPKRKNSKTSRDMLKLAIRPLTRGL